MAPTRAWTAQSNSKFIRLYKEQICLWNTDDPGYRDKFCRQQGINAIVTGMGISDLTPMEVKRRIKSLRATFCMEVKKIVESMQSNDGDKVYQPKLSWFDEMNEFIKCYGDEKKIKGERPKYKIETLTKTDNETDEDDNEKSIFIVADDWDTQDEAPAPSSQMPRKRSRLDETLDEKNTQTVLPRKCTRKVQNEFEIFGMHVTSQLRLLSAKQAIIAQEEIQSILTQGRLRDLEADAGECSRRTRNNLVTVDSDASAESFEDDLLKERQYF